MFDVEIKNLKISANVGITPDERKKKQLLKVTLNFSYSVAKGKDLESMNIKYLNQKFGLILELVLAKILHKT